MKAASSGNNQPDCAQGLPGNQGRLLERGGGAFADWREEPEKTAISFFLLGFGMRPPW